LFRPSVDAVFAVVVFDVVVPEEFDGKVTFVLDEFVFVFVVAVLFGVEFSADFPIK